jgi:dihydrofolate reductase
MSQITTLSLIWAMDENRLIGNNNALPWHLPADMQWFRQQTMGKPILMGRKTFESIGKPLPGRENIVLTRQQGLTIEGCHVVNTLSEAKAMLPDAEEIMVIGGAEIYAQSLPVAEKIYYTQIHHAFEGDAWFPELDMQQWRMIHEEMHTADEKNGYDHTFMIMTRKS